MRHVADSVEGADAKGLFRIGWIKQNASAIAAAGKNFGLHPLSPVRFQSCRDFITSFFSGRTVAIKPANKSRPPNISVGMVGMLTPSGRFTCNRGTRSAITPATNQNRSQAFHHLWGFR